MYNAIIKSVISYLIIASIFIMGNPILEMGFFLYWYHLVYILFAVYAIFIYHSIDAKIFQVLLLIIVYSLLTYQYEISLVLKQLINITFTFFIFYNFIKHEKFDFEEIFRKYIVFSKVVLVLGFIQVFLFSLKLERLFFLGFPFLEGTNINIRMQSITQEPSFLANTFVPIVFLSFYNLMHRDGFFINKKWSLLFIIGYILTFSIIAYLSIIIMLLALYFKVFTFKKLYFLLLFFSGLFFFALLAYQNVEGMRMRVDDTLYGVMNGIVKNEGYQKINLSTYALLSNAYVTKQSLQEHFFTGSGLGTYSATYDKYIPVPLKLFFVINNEEAGSLALRLLSETGVIGFSIFCFFLFKHRIRAKPYFSSDQKFLWVLNASIFVLTMLLLLRSGDYTANGRILFFLIYYYTYSIMKKEKISQSVPSLSSKI